MFFMNEMEATQFLLMIKEVGWIPSNLIKSNLKNFTPPAVIINKIKPENALFAEPILVHIMLLFYTSKLLLNKMSTTVIIQQYIELNMYPGFGKLFNAWVRFNQALFSLNLQKLNSTFNRLSASDVAYKIPDRAKYGHSYDQIQEKTKFYNQRVFSIKGQDTPEPSFTNSNRRSRRSSFNSLGGNFDVLADFPSLSRNPSIEQRGFVQPIFSRNSSIGYYYDDAMLGKKPSSGDNDSVCSDLQDILLAAGGGKRLKITRFGSNSKKGSKDGSVGDGGGKEFKGGVGFDLNLEIKNLNV